MSINKLSNDLVEATKKVLTKEEEYKDFFKKVMKKFGVKSPGELSGDKEKEFYNYIDKNWKGKKEDIDKMQEWISACGERRRVKEGDSRRTKVEDVIRGMWEESAEVEEGNFNKTMDKHFKKHAKAMSKGPKGRFSQKKTMNFRKGK